MTKDYEKYGAELTEEYFDYRIGQLDEAKVKAYRLKPFINRTLELNTELATLLGIYPEEEGR